MSKSPVYVAIFVMFGLITGCTKALPDTHDADVLAIKDTEAAWLKDTAEKDVEKFLAHYTDDASVLIPQKRVCTGKAAIRNTIQPLLSDPNFAMTFGPVRIGVAKSGDLGYSKGPYALTVTDPITKAPVTEKGNYLTVYKKQPDLTWKAVEDTFIPEAAPSVSEDKGK